MVPACMRWDVRFDCFAEKSVFRTDDWFTRLPPVADGRGEAPRVPTDGRTLALCVPLV